jgi:hypothetical protein
VPRPTRGEGLGPGSPTPEDEYGPVELGGGLHLISLALFFAALGARFLVDWLPPELRPLPKPALTALAVPFLAALGLVAGLMGMRARRGREIARLGVFLNGTALGVALLLIAVLYAFFFRQ